MSGTRSGSTSRVLWARVCDLFRPTALREFMTRVEISTNAPASMAKPERRRGRDPPGWSALAVVEYRAARMLSSAARIEALEKSRDVRPVSDLTTSTRSRQGLPRTVGQPL